MTKNHIAIYERMIGELAETYSNAGCNDMHLADTPENRQLINEAEAYQRRITVTEWLNHEDYREPYIDNGQLFPHHRGEIVTHDSTIFHYLTHVILNELKSIT